MKGTLIRVGEWQGRETAALIVDGVLEDLIVDADAPRPGTIYRARAVRPVKGMGGMFLDTPEGRAFLRSAKGMAPGELPLVQVTGYAEAGKAIPVTDRILFKSRYVIVTPGAPGINVSRQIKDDETRVALRDLAAEFEPLLEGCGLILRSSAQSGAPDDIAADLEATLSTALTVLQDTGDAPEKLIEGPGPEELAWRDWPAGTLETGDLAEDASRALSIDTPLAAGANLCVEPTRAFVAVDVNTGGDTSPAAGLKANIAAARALPRALRLKGLGGQIVVDFAPMPKKDRKGLENALRTAFRSDDVETALVGWTPLGHYELSRKRARAPLHEITG